MTKMIDMNIQHAFPVRSGGFKMHIKLSSSSRRLAFFGSSGSGKTLTLQAIAGLFNPQEGHITVSGSDLLNTKKKLALPARQRNLGYLFQDYAIFPHLTVRQNIEFSLNTKTRAHKGLQKKQTVDAMLEAFELDRIDDSYPARISGGQKQRVALARAMVSQPNLLLLDEPFSALDPLLRNRVREQCRNILDRFDLPSIMITHDPVDVLAFADAVSFYQAGHNSPCYEIADLDTARAEADDWTVKLIDTLLRVRDSQEYLKKRDLYPQALGF